MAADLRQGEHIPKMQNNKGRKSMLHVLRQLRSKDGGGGGAGCRTVPCHAVSCRATPRGARPGAAFCTTAINLRQIEFGSAAPTTPRWARTDFLQISNLPLYQLCHTSLVNNCIFDTTFTILYSVLYYTILYYTILYYTIRYLCREGFIFLPCNN